MRAALLLSFVLALASAAASEEAEGSAWVFDEEFVFLEFHDPGVMVLRDAAENRSELEFGYENIPYEVVSAWPPEKPLRLRYAAADGAELTDPETEQRYPLPGAWPRIDALLERCRSQAVSMLAMQACDGEALAAWQTELDRAYERLLASGLSEDTKTALHRSQGEWKRFRDAQLAALRAYASEGGGSLRRLATSSAALSLTKDRAGMLLSMQAPAPAEVDPTEEPSEPLFPKSEDFPGLDAYESVEAFQAHIDRVQQRCIDQWVSSSLGSQCGIEDKLWDRELNAGYQALMGVLNDDAKQTLRRSQRSWVASRDETLAMARTVLGLHYDNGERMWDPIRSLEYTSALAELTKARTLLLRRWKRDVESPASELM